VINQLTRSDFCRGNYINFWEEVLINIPNESAVKRVIQKQRCNLNPYVLNRLKDFKIEGK